jgi:hypothetical protein
MAKPSPSPSFSTMTPMTRPSAVSSGPPELPGLTAASVCTTPGEDALMIPLVTDHASSPRVRGRGAGSNRGCPMANTASPILGSALPSSSSGVVRAGRSSRRMARSFSRSCAITVAPVELPSRKVTRIGRPELTTWKAVPT